MRYYRHYRHPAFFFFFVRKDQRLTSTFVDGETGEENLSFRYVCVLCVHTVILLSSWFLFSFVLSFPFKMKAADISKFALVLSVVR